MLLADKVVLVAGVGPGLGQAVAVRAAQSGADVVLAARTGSYLSEVAGKVEAAGRRALVVPTDLTDDDAAATLVREALGEFGRVDGLVNNAFAMPPMRSLGKVDFEELRANFEVNVLAALRLTRLLTPALIESGGSVVMVNSAVLRHSRKPFGPPVRCRLTSSRWTLRWTGPIAKPRRWASGSPAWTAPRSKR